MDLALCGSNGTDSMWKILYNCQTDTALHTAHCTAQCAVSALHSVQCGVQCCADLKSSAAAAGGEKTDYYVRLHTEE